MLKPFSAGAGDRNRTGTILSNRRILSPVRLPVPPLRHIYIFNFGHYSLINKMEAAPRFELGVKDLQSSALPLGYAALIVERETGFEPATFALARRRSTTEPLPHSR